MSLTSGFFNSVNGDRRYNAEQMSSIFDGLLTDGVYASIGDLFAVTPDTGMFINIGTGRAWFNKTWIYNDSPLSIELTALSPTSLGRNDLIVLKIDHSNAVRACEFITITGTPASTPVDPDMPANDTVNGIYYYKFAKVAIPANTTEITAAMITNYIGVSEGVPFVTGLMQVQDLELIYSQLNAEFMDWWNNVIIPVLDEETVTLLTNRINALDVIVQPLNKYRWLKTKINPEVPAYVDMDHGTQLTNFHLYSRPDSGYSYTLRCNTTGEYSMSYQTSISPSGFLGRLLNCTTGGIHYSASSTQTSLRGKYIPGNSEGWWSPYSGSDSEGKEKFRYGILYIPLDAVMTENGSSYIDCSHGTFYPLVQNIGNAEIVESNNRNAYPDSGTVGDFAYTYLGWNIDQLSNNDGVVTIYGEAYNNVVIDIGRIPKIVMAISSFSGGKLSISNLKNSKMLTVRYYSYDRGYVGYGATDVLVLNGTALQIPLGEGMNICEYTIICIG